MRYGYTRRYRSVVAFECVSEQGAVGDSVRHADRANS